MRLVTMACVLVAGLSLAQGRPSGPGGPPMPPGTPQPPPPAGPPMGPGRMGMGPGIGLHGPPGIPPQVAQKLGVAPETVKKVRDLGFDANEALIPLEAELKKAQLELERAMAQGTVEESQVFARLDAIAKAELAVRKNRVGLMLKIRKLLGPEVWEKLQAEMPPPELMGHPGPMGGGGPMMHHE